MYMTKDLFPRLHPLRLQRLIILFVNVGTKKTQTLIYTVSISFPLNICFAFIFRLYLSTEVGMFPKKKFFFSRVRKSWKKEDLRRASTANRKMFWFAQDG